MKALWITADFHPDVGGLQSYTLHTVEQLSRLMTVALVTDDEQHFPSDQHVAHHPCGGLGRPTSPRQLAAVQGRLRDIVARERPDVIHLANAGLAVYAEALARSAPVAVSIHGNDLTSPWQTWPHEPAASAIRRGLRHCVRCYAVSHYTAGLVREFDRELPVEIIPQGCDLATFHPRRIDARAMRAQLGLPPDDFIMLTCARLVERKGHRVILSALRAIDTPISWIVVGTGTWRTALKLWLLSLPVRRVHRVRFLGNVDTDRLVELYNLCDVFVLVPTERRDAAGVDSEGFGLVFLEAAACGKPAIASATGGCTEAVSDGETGIIVPPDAPMATAAAIRAFLVDAGRAAAFGNEARRRIEATGGWTATARAIHRSYLEILDRIRGDVAPDAGSGVVSRSR